MTVTTAVLERPATSETEHETYMVCSKNIGSIESPVIVPWYMATSVRVGDIYLAFERTATWHLEQLQNGAPIEEKRRYAAVLRGFLDSNEKNFPNDVRFYRRQLDKWERPSKPPEQTKQPTYTAAEIRRMLEQVNRKPELSK